MGPALRFTRSSRQLEGTRIVAVSRLFCDSCHMTKGAMSLYVAADTITLKDTQNFKL